MLGFTERLIMKFRTVFAVVVAVLLISNSHAKIECELAFSPVKKLDGGRQLNRNSPFNIASYNILHFEYSPARQAIDPASGRQVFYPEKISKNGEHLEKIAKIIECQKLDIISMQEVQGRDALNVFNQKYLDDNYEVVSLPGNDPRGYEVGFLIKKDLPLKFKVRSHRNKKEFYSVANKEIDIYSRDLPTLYIWKEGSDETKDPDLILMGTHLKSQRDAHDDPKSRERRSAQVINMHKQVSEHTDDFPDTPLLLIGDFNADLVHAEEFQPIKNSDILKDSFEIGENPLSNEERVTHSFHPSEGETNYSQMDAIFLNQSASEHLERSFVYRYKDESGRAIPIPRTYRAREMNPSDHFPVISNFRFSLFD